MTTRSRTLFHFTKNLNTLQCILTDGFWPRYCAEDTSWHDEADATTVAFPMVCFCDIPLSKISEHVNFYGGYGLGMTREWAIANNLNPIFYLAGENSLVAEIRTLNDHANLLAKKDRSPAKETLRYIYAHIKPVRGVMTVDGTRVEKDFYLEFEWRHVPKHNAIEAFLLNETFANPEYRDQENEKTRQHCRLKLTPRDVKYIFVPTDADIPEVINFIQTKMDNYPHVDTKVLMSRVTSLESIQEDV